MFLHHPCEHDCRVTKHCTFVLVKYITVYITTKKDAGSLQGILVRASKVKENLVMKSHWRCREYVSALGILLMFHINASWPPERMSSAFALAHSNWNVGKRSILSKQGAAGLFVLSLFFLFFTKRKGETIRDLPCCLLDVYLLVVVHAEGILQRITGKITDCCIAQVWRKLNQDYFRKVAVVINLL